MELPGPIDKLQIVYYPDPVLRTVCAPVDRFDDELRALARRMLVLMREANGVGLAAPQVGVRRRVFVCNHTGQPEDDRIWVNPVLSDLKGAVESEEGCLSLPGVSVMKRRASDAVISGFDENGEPQRAEASELLARVWQHESDHLDGVLVCDAMTEADQLTNRKALKQLEADFAAPGRT